MTDDHFHYNDDSCLRQVLVTTWRKVEGREDEREENCGREEIHRGSCDHYVGQGWDDYDGFSNLIMMVVDGIEELRWGSVFENIIVMTPITLIMTLMVLECRWWWKPEPREVVGVLLRCVQEEKVGHLCSGQNSLRDQPKDYKKKMIMPPGGLPRKGPGDPLGEEHLAPLKVSFNILLIYISL